MSWTALWAVVFLCACAGTQPCLPPPQPPAVVSALEQEQVHKVHMWGRLVSIYAFRSMQSVQLLLNEVVKDDVYKLKDLRLPRNATILDIGANIGITALSLSILFPTARIFAFEPHPVIFQMLAHNMAANNVTNVQVHNLGLAKKGEPLHFVYFPNRPEMSIAKREMTRGTKKKKVEMLVNTTTLGCVRQTYQFNEVDLLKLDCEGCEREVIPMFANLTVHHIVGELHGKAKYNPYLKQFMCNQTGRPWGYAVEKCW